MRMLFLSLLIAACPLIGETKVQGTADHQVRSLTLKMRVTEIVPLSNNGLRITAQAESAGDNWGFTINIPGGKFAQSDSRASGRSAYDFPAFLEPTTNGDVVDKLLTVALGKGSRQTLFKPRGYSASAFMTPKKLGQKGGRFFLTDPGVDGGIIWNITADLDPKKHTLSFEVHEESY